MEINFYTNNSQANKINKSLTTTLTLTGSLKNECSVMRPTILIENVGKPPGNYLYIPDFGRYYFITDIKNVFDQMWEVSARVDVLQSFSSSILAQSAVLEKTQSTLEDVYINDPVWATKVKETTEIVQFPSGLLESGTFILITAGGAAT